MPAQRLPADPFRTSALITPDRLKADWRRCFDTLLEWAEGSTFILPGRVLFVAGKVRLLGVHMRPPEAAFLLERSRFGHSTATADELTEAEASWLTSQ